MTTELITTRDRRFAQERQRIRRRQSAGLGGRSKVSVVVRHVFLIATSALMLYPLLWMVVSSLRPNDEIFRLPGLWPLSFEVSNYTEGWNALSPSFGTYLWNSIVVVAGSIVGNLISCSMAAYAFARLNFHFKRTMFAIMLVTIMLPCTS